MARGGARPRSGPLPDPDSERSDKRGYSLMALPAGGYKGKIPKFPLPERPVLVRVFEDGRSWDEKDVAATERVRARELEVWEMAWRTPQACAWSMPSEQWRHIHVANWVRAQVICEGSDAKAADRSAQQRLAEEIGLTQGGLRFNGWAIKSDELAEKRESKSEAKKSVRNSSRDRLKRVQ